MNPSKLLGVLICVAIVASAPVAARAAPFVPASDSEILERLPFRSGDPVMRDLRALQGRVTLEPGNLPLAIRLAQDYLELGRATGDPRYAGYVESALAPWWSLERAPPEVLVLRATLRQRAHQFDAALADLATVLNNQPRNAQARLTRATVLQVQGAYESARQECSALKHLVPDLVWAACLASVNGLNGKLHESYTRLRAVLDQYPHAQSGIRVWGLTSLAEMAARAGMVEEADAHFRAALAVDAADNYVLSAYTDFLLDQGRPGDVAALLQDKTRADPLLLRYALALQAQHSKELPAQVALLRDRFAASRLRGDRAHQREEARFTLHLLKSPDEARKLALENWQVQKEPADVRILLEAALAARDAGALAAISDWVKDAGLEDVQISRLTPAARRPG